MPIYLFQHPKTGEVKEIVQRMNDEHVFIDDKGLKWDRILVSPAVSMDTHINPNSSQDFIKKTRDKNYSLGQLWDMSAELSEKRGGMSGKDEIRAKAEESYKKKTGKSHPHAKKKSRKVIEI